MLPTVASPHARMEQSPRASHRTAPRPATAAKHPHSRLCPRCNQWRTHGQYPHQAVACGACWTPPTAPRPAPTGRRRNADDVLEDLAWLLDAGTAPAELPRRLGWDSTTALDRWLRRHGRPDLAGRIWPKAAA